MWEILNKSWSRTLYVCGCFVRLDEWGLEEERDLLDGASLFRTSEESAMGVGVGTGWEVCSKNTTRISVCGSLVRFGGWELKSDLGTFHETTFPKHEEDSMHVGVGGVLLTTTHVLDLGISCLSR